MSAARAWRRLRRMDTALLLLLAVGVAAMLGTLIPQVQTAPDVVAAWRAGQSGPGASTTRVLEALGLLDILRTWWLQGLIVLLLVSLAGCIVPRARALARERRRPVPGGRNLERLRSHAVIDTGLTETEALARVAAVLRRRRMRVRFIGAEHAPGGHAQVAAERGTAREAGSLVFHASLLLLLCGAALASLGGFRGQVDLVEGQHVAETGIVYADAVQGPWWSAGSHRGFLMGLERFTVRSHPDGTPAEFLAEMELDGQPRALRVGQPLRHHGMTVHLARHGVAPRVRVLAGARVLAEQPVLLRQAGDLAWAGSMRLRLAAPGQAVAGHPDEIWLQVVLLPDAGAAGAGRTVRAAESLTAPVLLVEPRGGSADGPSLGPAADMDLGGRAELLEGLLTVEFLDARRWAGFQVSHVPGRLVLLSAAAALLVGLTVSLRAYRRRVWAEARPLDGGTRVVLAGVARSRADVFAERWPGLRAEVERALRSSMLRSFGSPDGIRPMGALHSATRQGAQRAAAPTLPEPPKTPHAVVPPIV